MRSISRHPALQVRAAVGYRGVALEWVEAGRVER